MNIFKHPYIIAAVAAIVLISAGSFIYYKISSKPLVYDFIEVKRGSIAQEVKTTGQIVPAQSADLGFERSGKIARVNVAVGQQVSQGKIMIELVNSDIEAQLIQAQADLRGQEARLDQMKSGARKEDLELKQSQLDKAKQDLSNMYSGAPDILNDSYTKADDAVRRQTDGVFTDLNSYPKLIFQTMDAQLGIDTANKRTIVDSELALWKTELSRASASSTPAEIEEATNRSQNHLAVIRDFLSKLNDAIADAVISPTFSKTTIDANKTTVSAARSTVNASILSLNTLEQGINSQKSVVKTFEDQVSLTTAGSTSQEIEVQQAQVDHYVANVKNIQAQLDKTVLTAPFTGTVAKLNANIGEIISPNISLVSMISDKQYQIDTNLGEADIAKVKLGDTAAVTLDAYGTNVSYEAKIISIEQSETLVNGIPVYKTTLQFTKEDDRIRSGMTGNIDIVTKKNDNAILLPKRAMIRKDDKKVVMIADKNGQPVERQIEIGIEGSDMVEILSGLNEGGRVVSFGGNN